MADISAQPDPDDVPWSMPIVVLMDKANPFSVTEICESAARAVVMLLADKRTLDGPWTDPVSTWRQGRIRKVVRRARTSAQFSKLHALDGVTVSGANGALARAFIPCPVDKLPPELRKLQVSGSEPPSQGYPTGSPAVTIALNPALEMSVGKKAAQVSHAAQLAYEKMNQDQRRMWSSENFSLRVTHPKPAGFKMALEDADVVVVDAGFTEIPAGSTTAVASYSSTLVTYSDEELSLF